MFTKSKAKLKTTINKNVNETRTDCHQLLIFSINFKTLSRDAFSTRAQRSELSTLGWLIHSSLHPIRHDLWYTQMSLLSQVYLKLDLVGPAFIWTRRFFGARWLIEKIRYQVLLGLPKCGGSAGSHSRKRRISRIPSQNIDKFRAPSDRYNPESFYPWFQNLGHKVYRILHPAIKLWHGKHGDPLTWVTHTGNK